MVLGEKKERYGGPDTRGKYTTKNIILEFGIRGKALYDGYDFTFHYIRLPAAADFIIYPLPPSENYKLQTWATYLIDEVMAVLPRQGIDAIITTRGTDQTRLYQPTIGLLRVLQRTSA